MNADKLRDIKIAIEVSKELHAIRSKDCGDIPPYALSKETKALRILIELAEQSLSASDELPERKPIDNLNHPTININNEGFHSCLDIAEQVVAKKNARIEELEEALRPFVKYANSGYMRKKCEPGWIKECEKAKSALEKGD